MTVQTADRPAATTARAGLLRPKVLVTTAVFLGALFLLQSNSLSGYNSSIVTLIAINCLLAYSFNIIFGFCGQLSLAMAGLSGVGAYIYGVYGARDLPGGTWGALVLAIAAAALLSAAVGAPTFRLKGLFFAIVTFAAAEIVVFVIVLAEPLTGGHEGLAGIRPLAAIGIGAFKLDPSTPGGLATVALALVGLVAAATAWLRRSRVGAGWIAIREDSLLAESLTVHVYSAKVIAAAVSGAIAGAGGVLYANYLQFLTPEEFRAVSGLTYLAMAVVGGLGTTYGPLLGAALLTLLNEVLRSAGLEQTSYMVFGGILIVIVLLFPAGIAALGSTGLERARSIWPAGARGQRG